MWASCCMNERVDEYQLSITVELNAALKSAETENSNDTSQINKQQTFSSFSDLTSCLNWSKSKSIVTLFSSDLKSFTFLRPEPSSTLCLPSPKRQTTSEIRKDFRITVNHTWQNKNSTRAIKEITDRHHLLKCKPGIIKTIPEATECQTGTFGRLKGQPHCMTASQTSTQPTWTKTEPELSIWIHRADRWVTSSVCDPQLTLRFVHVLTVKGNSNPNKWCSHDSTDVYCLPRKIKM